jgi:hypothetical protein
MTTPTGAPGNNSNPWGGKSQPKPPQSRGICPQMSAAVLMRDPKAAPILCFGKDCEYWTEVPIDVVGGKQQVIAGCGISVQAKFTVSLALSVAQATAEEEDDEPEGDDAGSTRPSEDEQGVAINIPKPT